MEIKRKSNFEIMRIVCMILIIMSHYAEKIYLNTNHEFTSILVSHFNKNTIPMMVFGIWGSLGVAGFISITSWFMVDSNKPVNSLKFVKIAFKTWIYSIIILIGAIIFVPNLINPTLIVKEITTPLYLKQYWFITCYCIFLLIVPILKKLINSLNNKNLKKVCVLLILIRIYCLFFDEICGQISIFITIFFMIAYLKRIENNFIEKHSCSLFFLTISIIISSCLVINYIGSYTKLDSLLGGVYRLRSCSNILILFAGIFMLYMFKKLDISNNRIINIIAKSTMGVYVLHENLLFITPITDKGTLLYNEILHAQLFATSPYLLIVLICSSLLIFIVFSIIDIILEKYVINPILKITKLDKNIGKYIDKIVVIDNS